jgi:hypothetical protein
MPQVVGVGYQRPTKAIAALALGDTPKRVSRLNDVLQSPAPRKGADRNWILVETEGVGVSTLARVAGPATVNGLRLTTVLTGGINGPPVTLAAYRGGYNFALNTAKPRV